MFVFQSFVIGSLYEFYAFDLSVEQISVDRDYVDTMLQFRRTLVTPLLPCTIFTRNQTVLEEQMFTIYLGDVPEDVMLVSIQLNERDFTLPFTNTSTYKVTEVLHPNGTHGYTLKVLFHDPVVKQKVTLPPPRPCENDDSLILFWYKHLLPMFEININIHNMMA